MLYLIATPLGNLGDISLRAIEILEKVSIILCEDTRNTASLLNGLSIKNKPKLLSFYDEVEEQKIPEVITLLKNGSQIALLTDAGSPVISDPGFKLIKKCRKEDVQMTSIPGPSAVINSLVLSGLPCGRFCFLGFLPKKDNERLKILKKYQDFDGAKVLFESPFRLIKLLKDVESVFGNEIEVAVCREMTKKFEEVIKGSVEEVLSRLNKKIKGEITVVIS